MKELTHAIIQALRATLLIIGMLLLLTGCASSWHIGDLSLSFEALCWVYIGAGSATLSALGLSIFQQA